MRLFAVAVLALLVALSIALALPNQAQAKSEKHRIIHIARQYLGKPYRHNSWNCSDYTSTVYRRASHGAINMPDWDDEQRYYGRRVRGKLMKGDLLFFDESGTQKHGPVSHVAIYAGKDAAGDAMVYHASSYFGETVKSYLAPIDGYLYARRIRW